MTLRQREPRYENRALLDACYEISCTADWPHECGTSEPAHSNQARHGKGKSRKAHDCFVAALCRNAHRELDQGRMFCREDRERYWQKAHERTLLEMFRRGLVGPLKNPARARAFEALVRAVYDETPASTEGQSASRTNRPLRLSRKTGHANGHSTERPNKARIGWMP